VLVAALAYRVLPPYWRVVKDPQPAVIRRAVKAGVLSLVYTHLWLGQRLGTRITAFTPADERSRRKLDELYESLQ